jgi:hypothetical protein
MSRTLCIKDDATVCHSGFKANFQGRMLSGFVKTHETPQDKAALQHFIVKKNRESWACLLKVVSQFSMLIENGSDHFS